MQSNRAISCYCFLSAAILCQCAHKCANLDHFILPKIEKKLRWNSHNIEIHGTTRQILNQIKLWNAEIWSIMICSSGKWHKLHTFRITATGNGFFCFFFVSVFSLYHVNRFQLSLKLFILSFIYLFYLRFVFYSVFYFFFFFISSVQAPS